MKIAYVCADHGIPLFGNKGASVHIQELVKSFAELGHEVRVTAARLGQSDLILPAVSEKVRAGPESSTGEGAEAGDDDRLTKEKRFNSIGEATERHLTALHEEWPFELIYERYSLWSAAGPRAAKKIGTPCIVEVNSPLLLEQARFRKLAMPDQAARIEAEVFSTADTVVAVSQEVANYVCSRGGSTAATRVIPNGVDLRRYRDGRHVKASNETGESFVIGFVGSLKAWHGIEVLLDAFKLVRNECTDAHLLLVGDGPMKNYIDGFVRGAGLEDNVTMTGWVAHDQIPSFLRGMSVASAPYPKFDNFYFSPLKVFEYLASGLPVVASNIGQVASIIEDGRTGLITEPGNAADLAEKLLRLRYEPSLRNSLGDAAKGEACKYTWDGNARTIVSIANDLRMAS